MTPLEQKREDMAAVHAVLKAAGHAVIIYETVDAKGELTNVEGYHYASCTQCAKGAPQPFPSPYEQPHRLAKADSGNHSAFA